MLRAVRSELTQNPGHERIAAGLGSGGAPRRLVAPPAATAADAVSNGAAVSPEKRRERNRAPTPRQLARWKAVQQAQLQGLSMRATARLLGISRDTVRNYILANGPPRHRNGAAGSRGEPAQAAVRALRVVLDPPVLEQHLRLEQAVELLDGQELVAQPAVERLDVWDRPGPQRVAALDAGEWQGDWA